MIEIVKENVKHIFLNVLKYLEPKVDMSLFASALASCQT